MEQRKHERHSDMDVLLDAVDSIRTSIIPAFARVEATLASHALKLDKLTSQQDEMNEVIKRLGVWLNIESAKAAANKKVDRRRAVDQADFKQTELYKATVGEAFHEISPQNMKENDSVYVRTAASDMYVLARFVSVDGHGLVTLKVGNGADEKQKVIRKGQLFRRFGDDTNADALDAAAQVVNADEPVVFVDMGLVI
jgi:hypothetical protein